MRYTKAQIMQEVRTVIDQNQTESGIDGVELDCDTLELDDIIERNITTAATRVLLTCPLRMVSNDGVKNLPKTKNISAKVDEEDKDTDAGGGSIGSVGEVIGGITDITTTIKIVANENGLATIPLPADYLRLTLADMEGWGHPVREAVADTDDLAKTCESRFKAIRPNKYRPCVVEGQVDGSPTLKLYGAEAGSEITQAQYIPTPSFESDNTINLPSLVFDTIVYYTAALTLQTLGEKSWTELMQVSQIMLGLGQTEEKERRSK